MKKGTLALLTAMVWSLLGISLHAQTLGDGQVMFPTSLRLAEPFCPVLRNLYRQDKHVFEEIPENVCEFTKREIITNGKEVGFLLPN